MGDVPLRGERQASSVTVLEEYTPDLRSSQRYADTSSACWVPCVCVLLARHS